MQAADGKKFGNRQKMHRYEKAHEGDSKSEKPESEGRDAAMHGGGGADQGKGPRAQAHEIEGRSMGNDGAEHTEPEAGGAGESGDMVAREHGPAHEVHITHDHASGQHHVHSVHQDGHQNHSMHATPEEAHLHAKAAAGMPGGMEEKEEGEYPAKHKAATADGEEDDYSVPEL